MDQQKHNPKIEWGFYATTPRIVRTQYKNITPVEKWLYVCLKDLCGDTGTCYRALRVLALETDLAIGTLSTGIRHLHDAGLIHAEKKRRHNNPTAKEVWHITIVDIWQENAKGHPTAKRSPDEQQCSGDEHYTENVQEMNNNVHVANNDASKRSGDEQQCSNFDDRSKNSEVITITEERTMEEESEREQSITSPIASALSELDAAPSLDDNETHSQLSLTDSTTQEGETAYALPVLPVHLPSVSDRHDLPASPGDVQVVRVGSAGLPDGLPVVTPVVFAEGSTPTGGRARQDTNSRGAGGDEQQSVELAMDGAPQDHAPVASHRSSQLPPVAPERRAPMVVVGSLPAVPVPIAEGGATVAVEEVSHEQNRGASHTSGTVEDGPGHPPPPAREGPGSTSPKWNVAALVARAEALREKPFSESARPKETKAARKLFARKPDLTEEEFLRAWQRWDTQWWHENNGLFTITDLAAIPKNKSEMRLIIALEQLALPKKPPGERVITLPVARGQQWRSSFDDPDYDMADEFYPSPVAR